MLAIRIEVRGNKTTDKNADSTHSEEGGWLGAELRAKKKKGKRIAEIASNRNDRSRGTVEVSGRGKLPLASLP